MEREKSNANVKNSSKCTFIMKYDSHAISKDKRVDKCTVIE